MKTSSLKIFISLACSCLLTGTADAKPLKSLLMAFSTPQVNSSPDSSRYLNIKGLKWDFKQMQTTHAPHFSNTGHLRIAILGKSSVELRGMDNQLETIFLSSPTPSKQFKKILKSELGAGVVTELKGCRSTYIPTQKSYEIHFNKKSPIYVNADSVLSLKPTMSPLFTSFNFYLERPADWKC